MVTVESPSGSLLADVSVRRSRARLSVSNDTVQVLEPAQLGLSHLWGNGNASVSLDQYSIDTVREEFSTRHGNQVDHNHEFTDGKFTFEIDGTRETILQLRVSDDGVAYRYRLEDTGKNLISSEGSSFKIPSRAVAYLHPYKNNHETIGRQVPAMEASGEYSFPALFRIDRDNWVLLTEAGVDSEYAESRLTANEGKFDITFPNTPIFTNDTVETPWRVAVVGGLDTIVESNIVPSLAPDPEVDDHSWVRPGRVAWSWWSDHASPADSETQREYVDFAAEQGWEYVLVDHGWDPAWVPDIVNYATDSGIDIFIWVHWTELNDPETRTEKLRRWKSWGVSGIKIDFMDSDDQGRLQFYDQIAEAAAEHELMVNFHGSIVPTGNRRRWPHVMSYEGVYGAEQYGWTTLTPAHNTILPFTRNAVGPMDYTPVTFSADRRQTTVGHELALAVVYESGLQHFADSTDSYRKRSHAKSFLKHVPAAWDETVFVQGKPGSEATLARRSGSDWFVGSITAGAARVIRIRPTFLEKRREMEVLADNKRGETLERKTVTVGPTDPIEVEIPANGGFTARTIDF